MASPKKSKPLTRNRVKKYGEPVRTRTAVAHWEEETTARGTRTKYYATDFQRKRRRTEKANADESNIANQPVPMHPGDNPTAHETVEQQLDFSWESVQTATFKKTQNDYLREFLDHRSRIAYRIVEGEGCPVNRMCCECGSNMASWRCRDCSLAMFCRSCCRNRHNLNWNHKLEVWNGQYFRDAFVWEVGVRLYMGHAGKCCPAAVSHEEHGNEAMKDTKDQRRTERIFRCMQGGSAMGGLGGSNEGEIGDPEDDMPFWEDRTCRTTQYQSNDAVLAEDPQEDGDEWEDMELNTSKRNAPSEDDHGNKFVLLVDVTGLISLPVVWCRCPSADNVLQAIDLHLFPSSFKEIQTLFTFRVLRDFRMSNLEAKTTAYQFYQKLRRVTNSGFPHKVPNRYTELRRVSRQWRNVMLLKWNGFAGHRGRPSFEEGTTAMDADQNTTALPGPGELMLFCPACPQEGVNLGSDWRQKYTEDELMSTLVVDGNFTAQHLKQKRAADDVWLMEGQGMMTAREPCRTHLKVAKDTVERDPCDNSFKAVDQANSAHNALKDCTGIVGHACGRHGCYVPRSIVDLQKGERQANVDWSFCEALKATKIKGKLLHIYDIMCQWYKNFPKRLQENRLLGIPATLKIEKAIGSFHVHGHKDECLYRFGTLFIPGAGWIDGEILETLWSVLNNVSRSTRTATLAHRAEILDDHMNDSNWKKLTGMVNTIIKKYHRAVINAPRSQEYLAALTEKSPPTVVATWKTEIEEAEVIRIARPSVMDVMKPRIEKSVTLAERSSQLVMTEGRGSAGVVSWMISGFKLVERQFEIQYIVSKTGRLRTSDDKVNIALKREQLLTAIERFGELGRKFIGDHTADDNQTDQFEDEPLIDSDGEELSPPDDLDVPERLQLPFPSSFGQEDRHRLGLHAFSQMELELRRAFANDLLEDMRFNIGQKSMQYVKNYRPASMKSQRTRARDTIAGIDRGLDKYRRLYMQNRGVMEDLGLSPLDLAGAYRRVSREDLKASPAMTMPNMSGQSQAQLSWIWTAGLPQAEDNYMSEFYRIHWLRARAQANRWSEELQRTRNEMVWTCRYFLHRKDQWRGWSEEFLDGGHKAYALRQSAMWAGMFIEAQIDFSRTCAGFSDIDFTV